MNILIDTNIIIPLEDTARLLDPSLADMCRLSRENSHNLFIHPAQNADIQRDSNESRRDIVLSRIRQYQEITSPPTVSSDDLNQYGWGQNNDNDRVDNLLLQAVNRGAVHILVTNDNGIHRKARRAGVEEQVHRLDQFLVFLRNQTAEELLPPYGIQERYLYEFDVNQPFFDSLRAGYEGFDEWYLRSAQAQRKAWCVTYENNVLDAICIFKEEDPSVIIQGGSVMDGKMLKLCTFKVGESMRGRKLGERLLFAAFKYAHRKNIPYVYLHTFGAEHELLVSLCLEYGFELVGKCASNERDDVLLKQMCCPQSEVPLANLEYAIKYYPNYHDGPDVSKYLVPIQKEYHNDLFADTSDVSRGLFADDFSMYSPQSNTIKKAYLCHASLKRIKPGDLVLFYRTQDRKSVECVGVVEKTLRSQNLDIILPYVSKRTVFSKDELEKILSRKETLVILFRYMCNFEPIHYDKLQRSGLKGPFQSIRSVTHEQYVQCFRAEQ